MSFFRFSGILHCNIDRHYCSSSCFSIFLNSLEVCDTYRRLLLLLFPLSSVVLLLGPNQRRKPRNGNILTTEHLYKIKKIATNAYRFYTVKEFCPKTFCNSITYGLPVTPSMNQNIFQLNSAP